MDPRHIQCGASHDPFFCGSHFIHRHTLSNRSTWQNKSLSVSREALTQHSTKRKVLLSGDTRKEKREEEEGFHEHHAEEHGGEDLLAGARVAADTVESGGNDFALTES